MKDILVLNDEAHHCYREKPATEGEGEEDEEGELKGDDRKEAEKNREQARIWISLMDAIESGIVKLPRVPVADNIPGADVPKFRNLWEHIRPKMPKKGRGKAEGLDPLKLLIELQTALDALYGHYQQTYKLWQDAGIGVPPCFIVVCNNTSASKLVYDYLPHNRHCGQPCANGAWRLLPIRLLLARFRFRRCGLSGAGCTLPVRLGYARCRRRGHRQVAF